MPNKDFWVDNIRKLANITFSNLLSDADIRRYCNNMSTQEFLNMFLHLPSSIISGSQDKISDICDAVCKLAKTGTTICWMYENASDHDTIYIWAESDISLSEILMQL